MKTRHLLIRVPLSGREWAYLKERALLLETSEGHVLRQSLRIYQLWQRFPQLGERCAELLEELTGPSPGCGGDE